MLAVLPDQASSQAETSWCLNILVLQGVDVSAREDGS